MYVIALTGSTEPKFYSFNSLDELERHYVYKNRHRYAGRDTGDRVDILLFDGGAPTILESIEE